MFTHSCARAGNHQSLPRILVPSVMLLPAGRGRAEKKQNRTSSDVRGAAPVLLSALGGKRTRGSGLALLLSPLLCPGPALLSVGHVLLYNTPLFPPDIESNGISIHVQHLLHTSGKTAEFALFETFFFFFLDTQFTRTQNYLTYCV